MRPRLSSKKRVLNQLNAARVALDADQYLIRVRNEVARRTHDADLLLELVRALTDANELGEAADVAVTVSALTDDAAALVQVAYALLTAGRASAANDVATKVLNAGPHSDLIQNEAIFLRGAALGSLGRASLAERYLRDALDRDPQRPEFVHGLALFFVTQGRRDEALALVSIAEGITDAEARAETLEDLEALGLK